jgi:hypothetical protein
MRMPIIVSYRKHNKCGLPEQLLKLVSHALPSRSKARATIRGDNIDNDAKIPDCVTVVLIAIFSISPQASAAKGCLAKARSCSI